MLGLLKAAVTNGLISAPHFPFVPEGFPLSISVSSVRAIPGCAPPPGARARFGAGVGRSKEQAALVALAEAAERYSIQYDRTQPALVSPCVTLEGASDPASRATLCVGSPDRSVSSKGAAAGPNLEFAMGNAAKELIEQLGLDRLECNPSQRQIFDPASDNRMKFLTDYLEARLRQLRAEVVVIQQGYAVVRVVSCDPDGGRPTEGSAASADVLEATTKAAFEAVVSWRNMIELERNGVPLHSDNPDGILVTYRGGSKTIRLPPSCPGRLAPEVPAPSLDALRALQHISGGRLRVFDMTSKSLSVPVAKILLG